jgi:lipopolysaccharide export system protein LptA
MFSKFRTLFAVAFLASMPVLATAAGMQVAFGGLQHDSSLPVEVTADALQVDQTDGSAVFSGNVVVGQGSMRLSANRVSVIYANSGGDATGQISKMHATGNVVLVNGAEAAEANEAVYTIGSAQIVMTGNVLLTQGRNALSSQRMVVNLNTGQATMEGRVKTIFQAQGN